MYLGSASFCIQESQSSLYTNPLSYLFTNILHTSVFWQLGDHM